MEVEVAFRSMDGWPWIWMRPQGGFLLERLQLVSPSDGLLIILGLHNRLAIRTEHEHGLGACGLRRIRQRPASRNPTLPSALGSSSPAHGAQRSSTMAISLPSSRVGSHSSAALNPPVLNFGEDLSRFPSESLHSFSFAHQSEEPIHSRQNIIKRSIEFMRDWPGWVACNPGIATAQAKVSGDHEAQSMIALLSKAKMLGDEGDQLHGLGFSDGPLTNPVHLDGQNVFEKSFIPRSESPGQLDDQASGRLGRKDTNQGSTREASSQLPDTDGSVDVGRQANEVTKAEKTGTIRRKPPALARPGSLKRTYTDTSPLSLQTKLMEALAVPYVAAESAAANQLSPIHIPTSASATLPGLAPPNSAVHAHSSRWAPAAQAIFTTQSSAPWTILAANDLACLVFGVTKAEVRKLGILEVVGEERRKWLEERLRGAPSETERKARHAEGHSQRATPTSTVFPSMTSGITAYLLSKPSWRNRRSKTEDGRGEDNAKKSGRGTSTHAGNKSRGVLLCGDVVPIQKRNGAKGSASLWVKDKRGGLIWVLEEITEDVAHLHLDDRGRVSSASGATSDIWGLGKVQPGMHVKELLPCIPRKPGIRDDVDYKKVSEQRHFATVNAEDINSPSTLEPMPDKRCLRVSSFPHIAGMMVISPSTLTITSSNSVFSAALFGQAQPDGLPIADLIPDFNRVLELLTEEDQVQLVDGLVIPEHSFRRARAILAIREGNSDAAATFLRPNGLPARHRDGSAIKVDVQMRVVKSSTFIPHIEEATIEERSEDEEDSNGEQVMGGQEVVYALWITYSRHLHATSQYPGAASPLSPGPGKPPHQPSPGQTQRSPTPNAPSPQETENGEPKENGVVESFVEQLKEAATSLISDRLPKPNGRDQEKDEPAKTPDKAASPKKTINDFVILEDMGQGAYGQVKLARCKKNGARKMVLKFVTKRRILVDTWTRDRRLGTVPLEIHVLDYLRRDGLKHPNIVEMSDFFEDDVNYYIEMLPHGLPGMDLFDYIELRVNMEENECRSIFRQVTNAIHHLHTKALVVHRDIKDENVVLDGEGNIKLIDFGSAAYIKNGPFDVFVGTIGKPLLSLHRRFTMESRIY